MTEGSECRATSTRRATCGASRRSVDTPTARIIGRLPAGGPDHAGRCQPGEAVVAARGDGGPGGGAAAASRTGLSRTAAAAVRQRRGDDYPPEGPGTRPGTGVRHADLVAAAEAFRRRAPSAAAAASPGASAHSRAARTPAARAAPRARPPADGTGSTDTNGAPRGTACSTSATAPPD